MNLSLLPVQHTIALLVLDINNGLKICFGWVSVPANITITYPLAFNYYVSPLAVRSTAKDTTSSYFCYVRNVQLTTCNIYYSHANTETAANWIAIGY